MKFDKVFSSDFYRAIQTAEIMFGPEGSGMIKDSRLREQEAGDISPSSDTWINEYKRLLALGMSRYEIRPFGAKENIWDLITRVRSFIDDLEKEDGTVAVVAHAGVNDTFINLINNRKKNDFVRILQYNACVNIMEHTAGRWSTVAINNTDHIAGVEPALLPYDDQKLVKKVAKEFVLGELSGKCSYVAWRGSITKGNVGVYDGLYCGNKGTVIDVTAKFNDSFVVPASWKISKYENGITEYEIGHVKIGEVKHRVHLTELALNRVNANGMERIL